MNGWSKHCILCSKDKLCEIDKLEDINTPNKHWRSKRWQHEMHNIGIFMEDFLEEGNITHQKLLLHYQHYRRNSFIHTGSWQAICSPDLTIPLHSIHTHKTTLQNQYDINALRLTCKRTTQMPEQLWNPQSHLLRADKRVPVGGTWSQRTQVLLVPNMHAL